MPLLQPKFHMSRDNTVGNDKILNLKFIFADGHLQDRVDVADFKNGDRISLIPRNY